jgi:hypothetical protein
MEARRAERLAAAAEHSPDPPPFESFAMGHGAFIIQGGIHRIRGPFTLSPKEIQP